LPPQCTFWTFLASLRIAGQLLTVRRHMRERVWQAAHVGLRAVTLDNGRLAWSDPQTYDPMNRF
jgi:hypothetical protein